MHPLFHPLFVEYCAYFNGNEDYFECHEVLEEYWKEIAPREKLHPLVGYVQLATSMYHWRRENFNGAIRMMQKAIFNFELNSDSLFFDYIDFDQLLKVMHTIHGHMKSHEAFSFFHIPISNSALQTAIAEKMKTIPSFDTQYLLHKHMLRDRSEVIAERKQSIRRKKQ